MHINFRIPYWAIIGAMVFVFIIAALHECPK